MDTVVNHSKQENSNNNLEYNHASSTVTTTTTTPPLLSPTSPTQQFTSSLANATTSTAKKPKTTDDATFRYNKKAKASKKKSDSNNNDASDVVVVNDIDEKNSTEKIGVGAEKCCSFKILISVWFSFVLLAGWLFPVLISLNFAAEAATESLISLGQETTENMITKLESTLQDGSIASQSLINLTSIYGEWNTTTRFSSSSSSNSSNVVEATPEIKLRLFQARAAALALSTRPDQWISMFIRWARGASFQATQIQPSLMHTQMCFGNGVFVRGVTTANTVEKYNLTTCIVETFNLTSKSILPAADAANTFLFLQRGRIFALGPIWNATIAAMKSSTTPANTPFPTVPLFTQYVDVANGGRSILEENAGLQLPSFTCTKSQFEPTHLLPVTSALYYNPAAFTSVAASGVDTAGFASVLSSLLPPDMRQSARAFVTAKVDSVLRVLFWSHGSPITVFPYNASSSANSFVPEGCYLNGRSDYMGCFHNMSDYAGFQLLVRASAAALSPSATFRRSQYLTPTQNESLTLRTAFYFPDFDKDGYPSMIADPMQTDILFDRGALLYTNFPNLTLFSRSVDIHVFLPIDFFMENMRASAWTSIGVAVAIFVIAFSIGIVSLNRISASVEALVEELAADPFCERKDNLHEKRKNRFAVVDDHNNNSTKKNNEVNGITSFPGEEMLRQLEHGDGKLEADEKLQRGNSSSSISAASSSFSYWNTVKDLFIFTELTMVEEAFLELQDCFQQLRSFMPYQTTKNVGNTKKMKNNNANDVKSNRTNVNSAMAASIITAATPEVHQNTNNKTSEINSVAAQEHQHTLKSDAHNASSNPANSGSILGAHNNSTKSFVTSMSENNYDDDDLTASTACGDEDEMSPLHRSDDDNGNGDDDRESTVSDSFPATTLSGGAAAVMNRSNQSNNNHNNSAAETSLSSSSSSRTMKKFGIIQQRASSRQASATNKNGNDDDVSEDQYNNNFSDTNNNNNNNSTKNETVKSLHSGEGGGGGSGSGSAARLSVSVGGSNSSILKKSVQSQQRLGVMGTDNNMNSHDLALLNRGSTQDPKQGEMVSKITESVPAATTTTTIAESNQQQLLLQNRKNVTFNRTAIVAVPVEEDQDEKNGGSDDGRVITPHGLDDRNHNDDDDGLHVECKRGNSETSTTPKNENIKSTITRTSNRDRMEEIRINLSSGSDDDDDDEHEHEGDAGEKDQQGVNGNQNAGNNTEKTASNPRQANSPRTAARFNSPLHFNNNGRQSPNNYAGTALSPTKSKRRNNNNTTSPSNSEAEKIDQDNNTNDGTARYMIACVTVLGNEVLSELLLLYETHRDNNNNNNNNHGHTKNKNNNKTNLSFKYQDHLFGSSENFRCYDERHGPFSTAASIQQQQRKEPTLSASTSQQNKKSNDSSFNNNNKSKNSKTSRGSINNDGKRDDGNDDASDTTDDVENHIVQLHQQQQRPSASPITSNKGGENQNNTEMISFVANHQRGNNDNNNDDVNFNRSSSSNDSRTSSTSTAQGGGGGGGSRNEIPRHRNINKNNMNMNHNNVAASATSESKAQKVKSDVAADDKPQSCPAFTRYHEAVLKNILKLYLPSSAVASSCATGGQNTGGESPPSSKNIFSVKFTDTQQQMLEKIASASGKVHNNNDNNIGNNSEQNSYFIPLDSSSAASPPNTTTTQNNNNKAASTPSFLGITTKDLSILRNGTINTNNTATQNSSLKQLHQQQQNKSREVVVDFASPAQLSALKQYVIDRSKFIVDSIFNHLLKGSGAHVIEYRNDSFLICLRLSRKNAHSRLAQRFLFNLTKVSDVIKASENFFAPLCRDDDVVKTNWTLRGLAYRSKREELMEIERLKHEARSQNNRGSRSDVDVTRDPSGDDGEKPTDKKNGTKKLSNTSKKKSTTNLRLSALRQEGTSFSAINTALTAGLSVGRVKILHMTSSNLNNNKNKNKDNAFLTKNILHGQIDLQNKNNNGEKFKDIKSATSFASGNQGGNNNHNNNFDLYSNINIHKEEHQQQRRNEFNAAAISARPVTVFGHCVSEAILLESEIRKEVLLGRGFFVDVEPAALAYVKHVFGYGDGKGEEDECESRNEVTNKYGQQQQPQPGRRNISTTKPKKTSPTTPRAAPALPSNFEHRNFPEQQYLDSLSHAICFVVQSTSETLKNPISFYVSSDFTFNLKKSTAFGSNTLFEVPKNNNNNINGNNNQHGTCNDNFIFSMSNNNMGIGIDEDDNGATPRINILEIGRVLTAAFPSPLKALISSDFSEQQRQLQQRNQQLEQEEADEEAEKERQRFAREKAEREEEAAQKNIRKEMERREKRRRRKEEEKLAKEMFRTQDAAQMLMELELEEESLRSNILEEENETKSQIGAVGEEK